MFSDQYDLTQAVLEGRKTMTRRGLSKCAQELLDAYTKGVCVVPKSAIPNGLSIEEFAEQFAKYPGKVIITHKDEHVTFTPSQEEILKKILEHSTYKVGEVVAVAQRYSEIMAYLADSFTLPSPNYMKDAAGYNNKMYVLADLMPHRIRFTNIRIERIQDISDEDCVKEGICFCNGRYYISFRHETGKRIWLDGSTPREAFATLIKKLSGKKAWDDNPCVFVYEFELVQ